MSCWRCLRVPIPRDKGRAVRSTRQASQERHPDSRRAQQRAEISNSGHSLPRKAVLADWKKVKVWMIMMIAAGLMWAEAIEKFENFTVI